MTDQEKADVVAFEVEYTIHIDIPEAVVRDDDEVIGYSSASSNGGE